MYSMELLYCTLNMAYSGHFAVFILVCTRTYSAITNNHTRVVDPLHFDPLGLRFGHPISFIFNDFPINLNSEYVPVHLII